MSNGSNGETCTAEEWALSGVSGVHCLTLQQSIGLVVVTLSGFVSLSAVLYVFALIARNVIYTRRSAVEADAGTFELHSGQPGYTNTPATENESSAVGGEAPVANASTRLIDQPMDLFILSLFCGNFMQALGVVLEVKWINDGRVRPGSFCTVQGVFQNLGQSAVAMQTTIITLHTFTAIWWQRPIKRRTAWILVGTLWLFLVLFIAVSASVHHTPPFYYPTPHWCWIHGHYKDYRTVGENFWLWTSFAVAVSLYTPLFFYNVGYISPDENAAWTFKINSREEAEVVRAANLPTSKLLICAMAYCVPVLPTAMSRWFLLVHNDSKPFASPEAQFSVKAIFSLSGVSDVVVFLLVRENLLLFGTLGTRRLFSIPAPVRIGACVVVWIALNIFDVLWIYYYVVSATNPVPHGIPNANHEAWKAYYVTMYLYAFLVGLVNIGVWLRYIRPVCKCFTFTSPKPLIILGYFLRFLIIVLASIMCLSFFAPWIGLKVTQAGVWDRRCARFSVEVILNGRPYFHSIKENPSVASFYFGQPGHRTQYYEYEMTSDANDATISHLRLGNVTIPPDLLPVYHPLVQDLSYRFINHSVAATCNTNTTSSAVTIPCMVGSFNDGDLNLTIHDTRTGTVTKLRAFDKGVWAPKDDAPSVLLRDVKPDGSLGSIDVLRTAVTMQEDCTKLKLCLARERGIDLLAAVGLILKAQDDYAYVCTTPNSN